MGKKNNEHEKSKSWIDVNGNLHNEEDDPELMFTNGGLDINIMRIDGIGNMISMENMKTAVLDAMKRCTKGSDVYNTYGAVVEMLTVLSKKYDDEQ
jgi:hypothetical protein